MHDKILAAHLPSVMALAYLGDARHSLYVRDMLVREGLSKSRDLNRESLEYVTAPRQAEAFRRIEDMLEPDERDVYRRAANSTHLNRPKSATGQDYRSATGFEAVIGMLYYLGDEERIKELLSAAYAEESVKGVDNDTEN
ncbi:MAG: ribonuclease III [Clostridia bacterium]|nr:ribonuclease III [Clostridia bacterium]